MSLSGKSGIYKITNSKSNKVYIGSACDLRDRKNSHFSELRRNIHANTHLQNSFNKYGEESFEFVVLEYCGKKNLTEREQEWIDKYSFSDLYNILKHAHSMLGYKHRQESIEKMKTTNKRNFSESTKRKMSLSTKTKIKVKSTDRNGKVTIHESITTAAKENNISRSNAHDILAKGRKTRDGLSIEYI